VLEVIDAPVETPLDSGYFEPEYDDYDENDDWCGDPDCDYCA
jgi:hypothetical protein